MIISSAFAQAAEQAATTSSTQSSTIGLILNFVIIFGVFYLLLIRPQIKKSKEFSSMLNSISKGDTIVTGGGIIAKIHKVKESQAEVDINDDTRVTILLSSIKEVIKDKAELNKNSEPTKAIKDEKDNKNKKESNKSSKLKKALEK